MHLHAFTIQNSPADDSHIDWHLAAGLAIVFAEDIPGTAAHNPVSSKCDPSLSTSAADQWVLAAWSNLCPTYNAFISGS